MGLKAQTGSGPRGADSGLAAPGNPGKATSCGRWGQSQDEFLNVSTDTAEATAVPSAVPGVQEERALRGGIHGGAKPQHISLCTPSLPGMWRPFLWL